MSNKDLTKNCRHELLLLVVLCFIVTRILCLTIPQTNESGHSEGDRGAHEANQGEDGRNQQPGVVPDVRITDETGAVGSHN